MISPTVMPRACSGDAVDVEEEPGRIGAESAEDVLQFLVLARFIHQARARFFQLGAANPAGVFHHELEAAGGAESIDGGSTEHVHERPRHVVVERGLQLIRDGVGTVGAGGERLQHDIHGAEIGSIGAEQYRLTGDGERVVHAVVLPGDLDELRHDGIGPSDGGRVGELHVHEQVALVLLGNEAGGGRLHGVHGQVEKPGVRDEHNQAHHQGRLDGAQIPHGEVVEAEVEDREKPAERAVQDHAQVIDDSGADQRPQGGDEPVGRSEFFLHAIRYAFEPRIDVGRQVVIPQDAAQERKHQFRQRRPSLGRRIALQQQGAQGRAQSQRVESGNQRADGDGHRKLAEELTDDAADEHAWHEHGREHQADRDNRAGDLIHGQRGAHYAAAFLHRCGAAPLPPPRWRHRPRCRPPAPTRRA